MSWPRIKLRELITLTGGHAFKSGDFEAIGIPLIRIGTANSGTFKTSEFVFLPQEYKFKYSKYLVNPGDLLITLTGTVGKGDYGNVCEATDGYDSYLLNQRVAKININSIDLSKRYLYLFLATPEVKKNLTSLSRGVRQANIKNEDILDLEIPLPPLDEQKRIAAILDKADAIRRKRQQAIQLADDFLRSVFLDMFGDPIANNKKWNIKELGELAPNKGDMVDGPFGSSVNTKTDYIDDGEIPVIRTKNVSLSGEFITNDLKFMKREKYETIIRSNVVPGDIVLTKVGTIGNVCIFPPDFKEAVLSTTGSCRIRVDESCINKTYLFYFLKYYRPKMHEIASAGVQPFLNMKHIKGFKVPMPDKKLQEKFADVVNRTRGSIALLNESSKLKLFDSLSQKAFAGEL